MGTMCKQQSTNGSDNGGSSVAENTVDCIDDDGNSNGDCDVDHRLDSDSSGIDVVLMNTDKTSLPPARKYS